RLTRRKSRREKPIGGAHARTRNPGASENRPGYIILSQALRMRFYVYGIKKEPHPEEPARRASRRTHRAWTRLPPSGQTLLVERVVTGRGSPYFRPIRGARRLSLGVIP